MKIGIVCYPTFGGSGVVATELGLELSKRGHEIHFISYGQPVRLELLSNDVHFHEVHVPEYPLFHYQPYELALSSKLVDMVKLHGIELLHVHYAIPHAYAAYMAQQMLLDEDILVPIVTTLHGTDITLVGSHPFYKPAVTFSINKSDAVTSVSESLRKDTKRLFNIERDIHVVPNFIDLDKHLNNFTDCQRAMMAEDDERIITHISNFREVKQIPDVIKIFYNVQKELPAKLMMVGEGPEKEHAENLVEELGISDKVIFFGNSNEIDRILCFSDLFLLPSQTESFGLAALEAMASSIPVISTNTGGLPEVNVDGYSGYLSDVNAVNDMTKNALKILKDPETLAKFKANAKAQSLKFDIHEIVPQYEKIYKETLKEFFVI
ncbi:N-acetyl-alpha-D-glucosaminyl L-malate synthase BshA [Winogradskyella sp.]|uniref:N-acetyl-alpha-D-glucosaminyl L-malate synthase BshA n=1 Tax=Winogradskyella sp. TaxID=1883156 RepID=UPI003F6A61AB